MATARKKPDKPDAGTGDEGNGGNGGNGGDLKLRGRFPVGTEVRLTKAAGPHQTRPAPDDEVIDTQTVDDDGGLEFSGTEPGARYFASGQINGQPVDVRLTGREDADDSFLSNYEPVSPDRQKLADGSWADEPRKREDYDQLPEGVTWLAQDQVPEGVSQRSDTPHGAAAVISADERERATRQWRKQEPTNPIVQETDEDVEQPARTAEPPDMSPAKAEKGDEGKGEKSSERDATAKSGKSSQSGD